MHRPGLMLALVAAGCDAGTIAIRDDATDDGVADTDVADTVLPVDTDPAVDTDPVADSDDDSDTVVVDACAPDDGVVANLAERGGLGVAAEDGRTEVRGDCTVTWQRYVPTLAAPHPTGIVLAHGFQRAPAQVEGWARHLASHGFEVLTPQLCHSSFLDTDHERNAAELVALAAARFSGRDVIFAGHSAGGLSSVLAAAASTQAVGVFGLDPVDADDLALQAAPGVAVPTWGLVGRPYACNSDGNGRAVLDAAPDGRWLAITDASHCDFEDATDWACTGTCELGFDDRPSDGAQRAAIRALLTAFALVVSGAEPDAVAYWTDGCPQREDLRTRGLVR